MPMEIQQQVHRDLERILKQPSFVIQHSVIMDNSDETYGPSPSICESEYFLLYVHRVCMVIHELFLSDAKQRDCFENS